MTINTFIRIFRYAVFCVRSHTLGSSTYPELENHQTSPLINHNIQLHQKYNDLENITKESLNLLQNAIRLKANENRSRYLSYLELNPLLIRSQIYNSYIPSHKLYKVTRICLISHSLQIELRRQKKYRIKTG